MQVVGRRSSHTSRKEPTQAVQEWKFQWRIIALLLLDVRDQHGSSSRSSRRQQDMNLLQQQAARRNYRPKLGILPLVALTFYERLDLSGPFKKDGGNGSVE
ncbi:unnamed protein product [Sphagnum troendelagicum]|uniref:Uncharacterized protein n=1 Tax=Sphagnum troendelagicum TaxID=128251 RepID=A0ABP0UJI7_9BRYO